MKRNIICLLTGAMIAAGVFSVPSMCCASVYVEDAEKSITGSLSEAYDDTEETAEVFAGIRKCVSEYLETMMKKQDRLEVRQFRSDDKVFSETENVSSWTCEIGDSTISGMEPVGVMDLNIGNSEIGGKNAELFSERSFFLSEKEAGRAVVTLKGKALSEGEDTKCFFSGKLLCRIGDREAE